MILTELKISEINQWKKGSIAHSGTTVLEINLQVDYFTIPKIGVYPSEQEFLEFISEFLYKEKQTEEKPIQEGLKLKKLATTQVADAQPL